jgi:hypothetical protein
VHSRVCALLHPFAHRACVHCAGRGNVRHVWPGGTNLAAALGGSSVGPVLLCGHGNPDRQHHVRCQRMHIIANLQSSAWARCSGCLSSVVLALTHTPFISVCVQPGSDPARAPSVGAALAAHVHLPASVTSRSWQGCFTAGWQCSSCHRLKPALPSRSRHLVRLLTPCAISVSSSAFGFCLKTSLFPALMPESRLHCFVDFLAFFFCLSPSLEICVSSSFGPTPLSVQPPSLPQAR